jgi:hypothetical protein
MANATPRSIDRGPVEAGVALILDKPLKIASSGKFVGDGERQRGDSLRNRRYFRQVESNDLC